MTTPNFRLLDEFRAAPDLDVWVVPGIATHLGFSPEQLLEELGSNYPSCGEDDEIPFGKPTWVLGDNRALKYRGHVLKREKMWFQDGEPTKVGFWRYLYTGWQWKVLPATCSVDAVPELSPITNTLKEWSERAGFPKPNHYIVTRYKDGAANIGAHYDKATSIAPGSLITVIKLGSIGRPFKLERLDGTVVFDKVLAPGTGVVMTLEANLKTKHSVPPCDVQGVSGSLVARTIVDVVSAADLKKKLASLDKKSETKLGKRSAE